MAKKGNRDRRRSIVDSEWYNLYYEQAEMTKAPELAKAACEADALDESSRIRIRKAKAKRRDAMARMIEKQVDDMLADLPEEEPEPTRKKRR